MIFLIVIFHMHEIGENPFGIPPYFRIHTTAKTTLTYLRDAKVTDESGVPLQKALKTSTQTAVFYPENALIRLPECPSLSGTIVVTREDVVSAVHRLVVEEQKKNVAILNFASGEKPGGGFLRNAAAQEEDICRHSGLYPIILSKQDELFSPTTSHHSFLMRFCIQTSRSFFLRNNDQWITFLQLELSHHQQFTLHFVGDRVKRKSPKSC